MSTYIVQKMGEWSLKHQSLSCQIVHYVYIHSSQEEGVVSETPKPIIARWCTMCTYIVHKTREWSLKHQSYRCPIVSYVYIQRSQDEGVVSETPKHILAR